VTLAHVERSADVARSAESLLRELPASELRHHRARLQEIARSRRLGLDLIERFGSAERETILRNRESARPDGRKLAIVVYPKSDHNGAFGDESRHIRSLATAGYRVMFYEARDVQDMVKALRDGAGIGTGKTQPASIMILGGHGSRSSVAFGFDLPGSAHPDIS